MNNLVYNCSEGSELDPRSDVQASFVGNRYLDTDAPHLHIWDADDPSGAVYLADNTAAPNDLSVEEIPIQQVDAPPAMPDAVSPYPSADATGRVLETVGARPADRTHHDERVVSQVLERGGSIIDSQEEVGGYPDLEATERTLDPPAPGDGLAEWLYQHRKAVELPDASPP